MNAQVRFCMCVHVCACTSYVNVCVYMYTQVGADVHVGVSGYIQVSVGVSGDEVRHY